MNKYSLMILELRRIMGAIYSAHAAAAAAAHRLAFIVVADYLEWPILAGSSS